MTKKPFTIFVSKGLQERILSLPRGKNIRSFQKLIDDFEFVTGRQITTKTIDTVPLRISKNLRGNKVEIRGKGLVFEGRV